MDRPYAYLFVWNPNKWNWSDLEQNIEELQNTGKVTLKWSCRSHKSIRLDDRAFLAQVGSTPRGIFASGKVVSEPFLSQHWSGENKDVPRVLIEFDVLLNPSKEPILTIDNLNKGNMAKQTWTPQSSGISIKTEIIDELEELWFQFLKTQDIRFNPFLDTFEKTNLTNVFFEGTATQVIQTRYERNPFARKMCIRKYGYSCLVCTYNFEEKFGKLGKNFIHVHHLTQISTIRGTYEIDPIKDLRPVCPNCHSMLHRRNPPLTIDELKLLLNKTTG